MIGFDSDGVARDFADFKSPSLSREGGLNNGEMLNDVEKCI